MKNNISRTGIIILIVLFVLFYFITTFLLEKRNLNHEIIPIDIEENTEVSRSEEEAKNIISNLYKDIKILYDVVNNKFTVDQDNTITIGNNVYKKITNFTEVMNPLFTENGTNKYLKDLSNYFAYTDDNYYLIGNLVSYQTYYFRGDNTNIYITDIKDEEIDGIIYEKRTTNNKNTLATIKVVNENGNWLVDDIEILSSD